MIQEVYKGRVWAHKFDLLVHQAKNGRYYRKYRAVDEKGDFRTILFFAKSPEELALPDTFVVQVPIVRWEKAFAAELGQAVIKGTKKEQPANNQ